MIKQLETYMSTAYSPRYLAEKIEPVIEGVKFDTFVGRGLSGGIAASSMALRFNKNYLVVRKEGDSSHAALPAFGQLGKRWIFIDDCIASGRTFYETYAGVEQIVSDAEDQHARWHDGYEFVRPEFVGSVLYEGVGSFIPASDTCHSVWIDRFKPELAATF